MERRTFILFTAASVVVMTVLMVFPLVTAIYLSLHKILLRDLTTLEWVAFGNYREILGDPTFWTALRFTLIFVVIVVPSMMTIGLGIALLLDRIGRGRGVYVALLLLPFIVTPVVGASIYKDLFERGGLLAWLSKQLFDQAFVITSSNVKWLIVTNGVWVTTGFATVVFFAGLQTLPGERVEAAAIDGAGFWRNLWHIVLPHLSSLLVFVALITIMDMYRVFDSVFVFVQRRFPTAETLEVYGFNQALSSDIGRIGKGNAIAILNVIGIMVVLIPFLVSSYRKQVRERT